MVVACASVVNDAETPYHRETNASVLGEATCKRAITRVLVAMTDSMLRYSGLIAKWLYSVMVVDYEFRTYTWLGHLSRRGNRAVYSNDGVSTLYSVRRNGDLLDASVKLRSNAFETTVETEFCLRYKVSPFHGAAFQGK